MFWTLQFFSLHPIIFFCLDTVTHMASKLPLNFSCLDAVLTTYHACVNETIIIATPSWSWYHPSTPVDVVISLLVTMATCIVGALLFSYAKVACKASFRHELSETFEVIVCLFTAHLSFVSLIMNSIWLFGQVLASVCDLLTLSPR